MPESVPGWQKATGLVFLAAAVAFVVLDWHRFLSDFWPPDKATVGPNLLASVVQWAIILAVAALIWPPTRRRIHRFVDGKTAALHARVAALHARHDEHAGEMAELHRKLDHLLEHTGAAETLPPRPDETPPAKNDALRG